VSTTFQINYPFTAAVSSKQISAQPLDAGPLPGYFSQCLSPTHCAVYQNQTLIWENKALQQANIYSC
jgi:hypothetical protein